VRADETDGDAAPLALPAVEEIEAGAAANKTPNDCMPGCSATCLHWAQCHGQPHTQPDSATSDTGTDPPAPPNRRLKYRRAPRSALRLMLSRCRRGLAPHETGQAPQASVATPGVARHDGNGGGAADAGACARELPFVIRLMVATDPQGPLAALLPRWANEPDLELLGTADVGPANLLRVLQERQPDLLVLDKRLFDRLSPHSVRMLQANAPGVRVLLWCDEVSDGLVAELLRHRFHGFLLSSCPPQTSVKAFRAVSCGELWMPRTLLADAILDRLQPAPVGALPPDLASLDTALHTLSRREAEVVAHLRQGRTNKEIARLLGIMEDTVKKHLHAVFAKPGVHRRALVALCAANGVSPQD